MESKVVKDIIYDIPILKDCREFYKIDKGWSSDEKYYCETCDGEKYLLRINSIEQQGDFHVGNLILTQDDKLGVIDFNRWDYGDPYDEFYKMMKFSREVSIPFARGQKYGYFSDEIPDDFFKLLALYLADVSLYSVVWAVPFGEEDVNNMLKIAKIIFADSNNFKVVVPGWFSE